MPTPIFLTIDAELAWRHHAAGLDADAVFGRSLEPAGVGLSYQLGRLAAHGLRACIFVDPMPALVWGLEPVKRLVGAILDAGQEVQLHCHPHWAGATTTDERRPGEFELVNFSEAQQRQLIGGAAELLVAAGAPEPVAFRAGGFSASDETLAAVAALGIRYDSSHNGAETPWPSQIGLPPTQVAPVERLGVVEVPVTVVEDRPGQVRNAQICALSAGEMRAALEHAIVWEHAAFTIVSHSFELANRAGTRPNAVHVRRFEALCALLAEHAELAPTTWFADAGALRLGQDDRPLGPSALRTRWRQAEQLWSNMVEERAA